MALPEALPELPEHGLGMVREGALQGQTPQGHAQAAPLRQQPGTAPELQTADAEDVQGPSRIQIEEQDGEFVQGLLYRIGTDGHQAAHASA